MTDRRPLRILFVGNYGSTRVQGGVAGIFVERQARSLRDRGVEVETFDIGGSHSPFALARSWNLLRRTIRDRQPDLLHAQYGTVVALVSVLTLHPTVITFGGSDLLRGASVSFLRTYAGILLSNVAALFARRVICVSEQLKRSLWWRRRGVSVIPRGVDLHLFCPGPRDEARRELGWDADHPVALIDGGRDWKNKGLDLAEAAVSIARREIPSLDLRVIRDVAPDAMPVWYRAADVLICASRQEGSPNVVKEAVACDLPVVGVDVGDVRFLLDGVTPSAVVARTPEAIANGVVMILRHRRRSNGHQRMTALSLDSIAHRIESVYEDAIGPKNMLRKQVPGMPLIEPIADRNLDEVVEVHMEAFRGYMNASMGRAYIRHFIRWFASRRDGIAIAAVDGGRVVGYVVGAPVGYERDLTRALFGVVVRTVALRPWLLFRKGIARRLAVRARGFFSRRSSGTGATEAIPQPVMSLVGIGVSESGRGAGVGRALMQAFEDRCRDANVASMRLSVYSTNGPARRLYERSGWTLVTPHPGSDAVYYYRVIEQIPVPGNL